MYFLTYIGQTIYTKRTQMPPKRKNNTQVYLLSNLHHWTSSLYFIFHQVSSKIEYVYLLNLFTKPTYNIMPQTPFFFFSKLITANFTYNCMFSMQVLHMHNGILHMTELSVAKVIDVNMLKATFH